ncbi:hypothetical protein [Nocardia seriolae]|uniref:Uncharacterized protein n=1 Tax=Nocardia seriolae TaxID=37332 RepID=A0ABC9YWB9_9NOCA|nr:hypothetical protein [Nocardia seriolae]APA98876.1 hypothetical protein NS506_04830 [Nocardia seriolae]OJF80462.1 hypothetical protein NS14008_16210 [Nocardia seriolae]PSK29750.1 hypothetical protein C6575_19280 [Nocardia seriolae]QOW35580.1 hypothetical protein IMZ23_12025 [Nocardia seriolae]QUN16932.1 hypothetical protein KEC46_32950 [Nocardia seriolae]
MSDAARQLSDTLRAPLPAAFDQLSDTELAELDRLLNDALVRHGANLDTAIGHSLEIVPRLMRPAIKKALGL